MMQNAHAIVRSITKTISINCNPSDAFNFLADPANWPKWAIVNVMSVSRTSDPDWWEMTTPHGPGRLRIRAKAGYGILDQDFIDPQESWVVPARVVANGGGTEFMITFFKPLSFTDELFDEQIKLVDIELEELKKILEGPKY
jgi:hypothetical protein